MRDLVQQFNRPRSERLRGAWPPQEPVTRYLSIAEAEPKRRVKRPTRAEADAALATTREG